MTKSRTDLVQYYYANPKYLTSNEMRKGKPMIIRKALKKDICEIIHIEIRSWLDTYPNSNYGITYEDVKSRFSEKFMKERREEIINDLSDSTDQVLFLVAIIDRKVVGYIRGYKGVKFNDLVEVYVDKGFRGKGIGKRLIEELFNWFGNEKDIILEVAKYNEKAINLYHRLGFVKNLSQTQSQDETWNLLPSGKRIPIIFMLKS